MVFRFPRAVLSKKFLQRPFSNSNKAALMAVDVPKGHFAVYVGADEKKRFVVPVSLLNQPLFLDLLMQAEDEYGFHQPMGGLTIPCKDAFLDLISNLNSPGSFRTTILLSRHS